MFGQLLKLSHHQLARISPLLLVITHCRCRQCLPLSAVQLKGKHCQKTHCRNGVVDTFRQNVLWIFLCLIFAEKITFLLVNLEFSRSTNNTLTNSTFFFSFNLVLRRWRKKTQHILCNIWNSKFQLLHISKSTDDLPRTLKSTYIGFDVSFFP